MKRKYAELSGRKSAQEELYDMLQNRTGVEAQEVLARIRSGRDPQSILRQIQEGDVLLQMALVPETRYRYEFPFIKEMPAFLQHAGNTYLNSLVYEWTRQEVFQNHRLIAAGSGQPEAAYLKPYHAAELVDINIESTKPSDWTRVPASDELMRRLLAAYFMYGYQWFVCFQKDYFLEDMAANRRRFCSPILVNAVLAVGYVCFLTLFSNPS